MRSEIIASAEWISRRVRKRNGWGLGIENVNIREQSVGNINGRVLGVGRDREDENELRE